MSEDNEKHLAVCEQCRLGAASPAGLPYKSWLCVPCDKTGYGYGCPVHGHLPDDSINGK